MQAPMKVLWFMSHAGQVRNFESTLRGLAGRGHQIHLAFERQEKKNLPGLHDLAGALVSQYAGITTGEAPRAPKYDWSLVSSRLRASVDYTRYLGPEYAEAPKLRRRAERFAPARVEERYRRLSRPGRAVMRGGLRLAERATPISESITGYLREREPDVVLVTPLLEPGSLQVEFLRAANHLGIPTCFCVASWDNLTTKGLIHELPDAMMVWNEHQVKEAIDLHHVPAERIVVTGAVPYDHWFGWTPSRGRAEFAAATGLDPARPFVLYVGSSGFIAPDEAAYIIEWVQELERQGLHGVQVLARPHPVNPLRGDKPSQVALERLENVHLYPPAGANPTNAQARADYFDSMYYCSAVAGVNTTAFLEAGIVGRPVFTVLADRYDETQRGVLHFQHLLNAGGGLLHTSETYSEHAADLRKALAAQHPEECVSGRSRSFTEAFIRPYGLDEPATPRMLAAIEEVADREKRPRRVVSMNPLGRMLSRAARRQIDKERRRRQDAKRALDEAGVTKTARKRRRQAMSKASVAVTPKSKSKTKPPKSGVASSPAGANRAKPPKGKKMPKRPKGTEKSAKAEKPPKAAKGPPKREKGGKAPKTDKKLAKDERTANAPNAGGQTASEQARQQLREAVGPEDIAPPGTHSDAPPTMSLARDHASRSRRRPS
jgi:hypothetical protein